MNHPDSSDAYMTEEASYWAMTNRDDARAEALVAIAGVFTAAADVDTFDALEALQFLLPEDDWLLLANMLEMCPMHCCDVRICADDEVAVCAQVRA
jgi:hypothetical protein